MKHILPSIRYLIFMTFLLGLGYPLLMTGISQVLFFQKANGSLVTRNGQVIGSSLIAQNFEKPEYFWPRPSAISYNPLPSGGSNLGPISADLKKAIDERRIKIKAAHADQTGEPPQDLVMTSASGLDPHISPEAAQYQLRRVSEARNASLDQVQKLIDQTTEGLDWGIFGERRVNVLRLNLFLDETFPKASSGVHD